MLTQNYWALVDIDDYPTISSLRWQVQMGKNRDAKYARTSKKISGRKGVLMHRLILQPSTEESIDHINGDGLDNRRFNLRCCNISQNQYNKGLQRNNKSGYRGVSWHPTSKTKGLWRANIHVNRKVIFLGLFSSKEEAAKVYDEAAKIYHGEFARFNLGSPTSLRRVN